MDLHIWKISVRVTSSSSDAGIYEETFWKTDSQLHTRQKIQERNTVPHISLHAKASKTQGHRWEFNTAWISLSSKIYFTLALATS